MGFKQGEKVILIEVKEKILYTHRKIFTDAYFVCRLCTWVFGIQKDLRAVKKRLICWFIDSIRRMDDLSAYYPLMDTFGYLKKLWIYLFYEKLVM